MINVTFENLVKIRHASYMVQSATECTGRTRPVYRRLANVRSVMGAAKLITTARGIRGCGIPLSALAMAQLR